MRKLGKPVLIVVDDIDRLQYAELLDLLRVVRLLGRFPGVDFLLAYDEQTLVETLQAQGHGGVSRARARSFMEKIVQYPLSIPPMLTSQIVLMLRTGLAEIVTPSRVEANFERHRFSDILLTTMPAQLDTPRAIERFLAQVREQFRAHDLDEMNDVDLILATFLRVQFPDVFSQLQSQKSDLTKAGSSHAMLDQQKDRQPDWDDLLATLERDKDRRDALAVMAAIFPVVRDKNCPGAQPGRFAHPDYFDRYLAQAIPEGDIPDALISRVLADAAMGDDAELRILLNGGDADLATLAFSKIRARFPDVDDERFHTGPRGVVTVALLQTAMTLVDQADEDRLTSLTSAGDQLRWWSAILVRQLLDTDPTCVVDPALLKCTNIDRRAHVLDTATRDRSGLRGETQDALNNALERELDRILPVLLDDLRERDNSDATTGTAYLYTLVAESSRLEELRNQITAGLAASDFTPEDVAARLVGLGYIVGGFWPPMEGVLLRRALHESDWHRGPVG